MLLFLRQNWQKLHTWPLKGQCEIFHGDIMLNLTLNLDIKVPERLQCHVSKRPLLVTDLNPAQNFAEICSVVRIIPKKNF